jgi:RNA polymerase-binding transcription factor DksA
MPKTGGKKISQQVIDKLRKDLIERERQIFDRRAALSASWANLHAPEIEFEEMAQKGVIAQGMDQLDDQERLEIQAIDQALRKIDTGVYGTCENCMRNISEKRLEAIPWTQYCTECAGGVESRRAVPEIEEEETASTLPPEYQGLSDEQIEQVIWDELREDGRVELEELEISCADGVIYLEGTLPNREKHEILLEIVEDVLGFHDVIQHLDLDSTPWEREDRTEGREDTGRPPKETVMEGEPIEEVTENPDDLPPLVDAPDHLAPERSERED